MNRETAVAAETFAETLQQLGVTRGRGGVKQARELGRRAALMAAADGVWRNHLGRLLTRDEVQELLGLQSRQAVSDLVKRGRLLGLRTERGTYEFPAFQIDVEGGRVHPLVPKLLPILLLGFVSPYGVASWFVSPQELLDGETPAEWLHAGREQGPLLEAAARTAARLER